MCLESVLCYNTANVKPENVEKLLSDFSRGRAQYSEYLTQKLHCWTCLPWRFASLNHPDVDVVRSEAQQVLTLLEESPKQQDLHHRVTWRFLCGDGQGNESPLLQELRQLVSGEWLLSFDCLSGLRSFVQQLRFLPTVERIQEADHSIVNRFIVDRKVSGPYVSTVLRMPEMQRLFGQSEDYAMLLEQYRKVEDPDNG